MAYEAALVSSGLEASELFAMFVLLSKVLV